MIIAKDKNDVSILIDDAIREEVYFCPLCGQPLIQKRGDIKAHHFAHKPSNGTERYVQCVDHWHYDMTDWHIEWQKKFPANCIEKVLTHDNQKHIADVAINNIVIEFQHSNISLSDFRTRNKFYKDCGYHVVWIFDLIEDYEEKNICIDDEEDNKYYWYNVKSIFRDFDLKNEDITLYFQFSDDEDDSLIERVTGGYKGFSLFYTDSKNALTVDEFVKEIQLPNSKLIKRKHKIIKNNNIKVGKTVFELWKKEYEWMVVKNLSNNKEMLIRGKNGEMFRQNYDSDGLILGKYSNKIDGKYQYSKLYPVWDAEEPIWKLIKYHFIKNDEFNIKGCTTLIDLIKTYPTIKVFYCNYTHKYYYIEFIKNCLPLKFNAFEFDMHTSEIGKIPQNKTIRELRLKKVWSYSA